MTPPSRSRLPIVLLACLLVTGLVPGSGGHAIEAAVGAKTLFDCGDCWPAAFTFTPDGKQIFYLERYTGEIRKYTLKSDRDTKWGSVGPVDGDGERGALGIAVDPRWNKGTGEQRKSHRWVYVFYTNESPLENRVVRLRQKLHGPGVTEDRLVTISIAGASNHNGGPIQFGPDGKLYVVTGELADPSRAQDRADPAGKVLRLNRNGGRPGDNPISGSLAFSYGHRNSFGFTFDPTTDDLWQTENGPECEDEVNLVLAGGNYGWGSGSSCPNTSTEGPSPTAAEKTWTPTIVPTGAAFCEGCGLGADVEGDLLVGIYEDGTQIRNLSMNSQRDGITGEATLLDRPSGVLALARRPNGQIYFSDSSGIYLLTG
jgi:glucose/arabinose dehydrogenase